LIAPTSEKNKYLCDEKASIKKYAIILLRNNYMSPTVFKEGRYRFHFFSKEEKRIHIHIVAPDGEAKFWIEPIVSLVNYSHLSDKQLNYLQKLIERRKHEIIKKWKEHFKS
jgi:hypothetical protein